MPPALAFYWQGYGKTAFRPRYRSANQSNMYL
jgi:hypothetical protein